MLRFINRIFGWAKATGADTQCSNNGTDVRPVVRFQQVMKIGLSRERHDDGILYRKRYWVFKRIDSNPFLLITFDLLFSRKEMVEGSL